MKSYTIHFIRHGITEGNIKGQYIGSTDSPLCHEGKEELREMAKKLDYPGGAAFFVSPMRRCVESLEILYPGVKAIVMDGLRECDFGEFEGLTAHQLEEAEEFRQWIAAPQDYAPPSGESGGHFAERVCAAFEGIVTGLLKTGITSAVVVTHGGVISLLLSRYGLPEASPAEWLCKPGTGFSVRIHPRLWVTDQVMEVFARAP